MVSKSRLIYLSQFLSAWGDRMWSFAVAIFLMDLAPDSLLLPAVYGLTVSSSVLMFGTLVGNWIDRTPRLRAAQLSLITQNTSVAVCSIILLIQKLSLAEGSGFLLFVKIAAIFLGVTSRLASVSSSIIIQKDWIVVICSGDEAVLASLNSVLRRIDLCTKLLAPLVCGQVITLVSVTFGCGFVAGWNVISMFIEYFLLRVVYNRTPDLAHKEKKSTTPKSKEALLEKAAASEEDTHQEGEDVEINKDKDASKNNSEEKANKDDVSLCGKIFGFLLRIPKGWKQYMSQSVAKAGIGLSFLYMTVLGFDAITTAYAYNQCFSEVLIGILLGASALTGIIATFLYAPLSARFGIVKAGLMASVAQVITLVPSVFSVFVAGSPFFLLPQNQNMDEVIATTAPSLNVTYGQNFSTTAYNQTIAGSGVFLKCIEGIDPPPSYLSLSLLMTGIVLARVGLWGFDLAVTQLYQQRVPESERGVVGGVQNSLNSLMDLFHFLLIVALPKPNQFGILVIISTFFVTAGHVFYASFAMTELRKEAVSPNSN